MSLMDQKYDTNRPLVSLLFTESDRSGWLTDAEWLQIIEAYGYTEQQAMDLMVNDNTYECSRNEGGWYISEKEVPDA